MKLNEPIIPILKKIGACDRSLKDYDAMTVAEAWNSCQRGDDMLWFFSRIYPEKKMEIIGASAHCANTVRHLICDERIQKCIDIFISYSERNTSKEELDAIASYAASAAAVAARAAASDAYDASDASDAAHSAAYARKENQKQTADICRKYLKLEEL